MCTLSFPTCLRPTFSFPTRSRPPIWVNFIERWEFFLIYEEFNLIFLVNVYAPPPSEVWLVSVYVGESQGCPVVATGRGNPFGRFAILFCCGSSKMTEWGTQQRLSYKRGQDLFSAA